MKPRKIDGYIDGYKDREIGNREEVDRMTRRYTHTYRHKQKDKENRETAI